MGRQEAPRSGSSSTREGAPGGAGVRRAAWRLGPGELLGPRAALVTGPGSLRPSPCPGPSCCQSSGPGAPARGGPLGQLRPRALGSAHRHQHPARVQGPRAPQPPRGTCLGSAPLPLPPRGQTLTAQPRAPVSTLSSAPPGHLPLHPGPPRCRGGGNTPGRPSACPGDSAHIIRAHAPVAMTTVCTPEGAVLIVA